jgi:hypothetical protein
LPSIQSVQEDNTSMSIIADNEAVKMIFLFI